MCSTKNDLLLFQRLFQVDFSVTQSKEINQIYLKKWGWPEHVYGLTSILSLMTWDPFHVVFTVKETLTQRQVSVGSLKKQVLRLLVFLGLLTLYIHLQNVNLRLF